MTLSIPGSVTYLITIAASPFSPCFGHICHLWHKSTVLIPGFEGITSSQISSKSFPKRHVCVFEGILGRRQIGTRFSSRFTFDREICRQDDATKATLVIMSPIHRYFVPCHLLNISIVLMFLVVFRCLLGSCAALAVRSLAVVPHNAVLCIAAEEGPV